MSLPMQGSETRWVFCLLQPKAVCDWGSSPELWITQHTGFLSQCICCLNPTAAWQGRLLWEMCSIFRWPFPLEIFKCSDCGGVWWILIMPLVLSSFGVIFHAWGFCFVTCWGQGCEVSRMGWKGSCEDAAGRGLALRKAWVTLKVMSSAAGM